MGKRDAKRLAMGKSGKGAQARKTIFGGSFGDSMWWWCAASGVIAFLAYGLARASRGSPAWAFAMVACALLAAPVLAVAIINAPRLLREGAAARAKPLEGVAFEGRSIPVEEFEGSLWACAISVAAIMRKPPRWAEGFRRAGAGMARKEGDRLWIRREAWAWRSSADGCMDLRRIVARIEADGFAPLQKMLVKRQEAEALLGLMGERERSAMDGAVAAERAARK